MFYFTSIRKSFSIALPYFLPYFLNHTDSKESSVYSEKAENGGYKGMKETAASETLGAQASKRGRGRPPATPGAPWRHLGDVTCYEELSWSVYWAGPYRLTKQRGNLRVVGDLAYRLTRRRRRWVVDADFERITRGRPELLLLADWLVIERAGGGDGVKGYQAPWTRTNDYDDATYRPRQVEGARRLREMRQDGRLTQRWAVVVPSVAGADLV